MFKKNVVTLLIIAKCGLHVLRFGYGVFECIESLRNKKRFFRLLPVSGAFFIERKVVRKLDNLFVKNDLFSLSSSHFRSTPQTLCLLAISKYHLTCGDKTKVPPLLPISLLEFDCYLVFRQFSGDFYP